VVRGDGDSGGRGVAGGSGHDKGVVVVRLGRAVVGGEAEGGEDGAEPGLMFFCYFLFF
jgi:hypothetical protein